MTCTARSEFKALLLSQTDTWQEVSTIHPTSTFTGDHTTVTSQLGLTDLYSFIKSVSQQAAVASTTYSADLQPVVHVTGTVGGQKINETFQPVLPFAVTQNAITLAVAAAVAPPGATYSVPSASDQRHPRSAPSRSEASPIRWATWSPWRSSRSGCRWPASSASSSSC